MHILVVSRTFPHHRPGGMEWAAQDLVEGLMEAGHRVSVLTTPLPSSPSLAPLEPNGEVVTAGSKAGAYDLGFALALRGVGSLVKRLGIDMVHAQGFAGPLIPRGVPLVTTIHGTLYSETALRDPANRTLALRWQYRHRYAFRPFWKLFLARNPHIAVDSEFTRQQLQTEAPGRLESTRVVPLGINLSRFEKADREAARTEWGIGKGDVLLSGISRLEEIKHPEWLIEAYKHVSTGTRRVKLVIAGEGPRLEELRRMAADLPGVVFTGRLEADRLPGLLAATDLFLNADHGAPAFGLANVEALVSGTAVVGTLSGAHPEIVKDGDGWLVTEGDLDGWRRMVRNAMAYQPESAVDRAKRAKRNRERFARQRMIKDYEALYAKAGSR